MRLVEAQEGRRALDRLVGFEVSPVLWRRVPSARSAGRVQSVAVRLVVERERERMAFHAADYWDLDGRFGARDTEFVRAPRRARRQPHRDRSRLRRRDWSAQRRLRGSQVATAAVRHLGEEDARALGHATRRRAVHRRVGRGQGLHGATEAAVQDHDAAAGSRQQASLQRRSHDVGRAGSLRAGLHHLHANRLDQALGAGGRRGSRPDRRAVRQRLPPALAPHLRREGEERAGGARGDSSRRRAVPHPRSGAR